MKWYYKAISNWLQKEWLTLVREYSCPRTLKIESKPVGLGGQRILIRGFPSIY
jgi:hypothetical protein